MITANIEWDFVPGSLYTTVEYKLASSNVWITPTTPTNPTTQNEYTIVLQESTYYDIRLTTTGTKCAPKSRTLRILTESVATTCCPPDYTPSSDGTYCYQDLTVAATAPTNPENTVAKTFGGYGSWGTLIYDNGYNINGTGTFTQIPYSNGFWVNGTGYPSLGSPALNGPLNRSGLWATTMGPTQTIGFTYCLEVPAPGVYYIGVAADNYISIDINGTNVLTMDIPAMTSYLASHGYPLSSTYSGECAFRFWHIYPVSLTVGTKIINVKATNTGDIAAMGAEIYDATMAQLISATSYPASRVLFTTKDYRGQPVQIGTDGAGYTCPTNYNLVLCDGPAYCKRTLTSPLIPC